MRGIAVNIVVLMLFLSACSVTKKLPEGEYLYKGHSLDVEFTSKVKGKTFTVEELESVVGPNPNRKFLGFKLRLWVSSNVKEGKREKGLKNLLRKNFGEPPVLYSDDYPSRVQENIQAKAVEMGYFHPAISYEVIKHKKKKKAKISYHVVLQEPYYLRKIHPFEESGVLQTEINKLDISYLEGRQFSTEDLRKVKKRVSNKLQDKGFYFFNRDALFFDVDTTVGNREVDLYMRLNTKKVKKNSVNRYTVDGVSAIVFDKKKQQPIEDTLYCNDKEYYKTTERYHPSIVLDHLYLKPGVYYNRSAHLNTLKHLGELGTFGYVNTKTVITDTVKHTLGIRYIINPALSKKFESKLTLSTKSNGLIGPLWENSITNKNIFGGAEQLIFKTEIGIEKQLYADYALQNVISLSVGLELRVPRLMTPWRVHVKEGNYLPSTSFKMDVKLYRYMPYFESISMGPSLMYSWTNSKGILFELTPLEINYRKNLTLEDAPIDEPDYGNLYTSLQDRFVLGGNYFMTLQTEYAPTKKGYWYWRTGFDASGNIVSLIYPESNKEPVGPDKILGVPYAQYFRIESEPKFKYKINKKKEIAMRLVTNVGYPYGNSFELPYFKQYSLGGPYSIRAFVPRTVGPGTFVGKNDGTDFVLHSGEIYLEGNIEYRFDLSRYFELGLFLDAGNIWVVNKNPTKPGGEWTPQFYEQIGVGTGVGFRLDFEYIVIRLDAGIPLRFPNGWVVRDISIFNKDWRRDYLIWNFAIGYPF